jgi:hypothetical protein
MASTNPRIMRWPIVVNWDSGEATIGNLDGVKTLIENLRKGNAGSGKDDMVKPKGWFW